MAAAFQSLFQLGLHAPDFLSLVKFFSLGLFFIGVVFSLVPFLLIVLFCLLPAPCCILVVEIAIANVFGLCYRFSEFCPWQDLAGLVFNFFCFFNDCISAEDDRAWAIGFLRHSRADGFVVIAGARARGFWLLSSANFWVDAVVSFVVGLAFLSARLWEGAWGHDLL